MLEAILLPVFIYLPGHFLGRRLLDKGDGLAELTLLRIGISVALATPLLVVLAIIGWFETPVILACLAVLAAGAFVVGRHADVGTSYSWWDVGALSLAAGSFALYARPAEYVFNMRDPGVYTLFAQRLARTGTLVHHDRLAGAVSSFHDFTGENKYPGFYIFGRDLIVPQFFPGPFAWLGLGDLIGGTWTLLFVVPVMGALSVGMAFALGSELFGRWAGAAGAALLAVSYTQVWWARHPSSEVMTQLLVLGGLWMTARFAKASNPVTGIFAGLLLGAAMLVRVDAFLAAAAIPLLFGYDLLVQRSARRWLLPGVPLAFFAGAALLYLNTLGGRYLYTIYDRHGLDDVFALLPYAIPAVLLAAGAFYFVRREWGVRMEGWLAAWGGGVALAVAVCIVAVALWAYFVLPVSWESLPDGSRDFDAYRTQILVRLVWFTTPVVAALGLVGFLLASYRLNASRALLLGAFLSFGVFYTVIPNVSPDLPWATRRFVPVVFPALCLLAGYALVEGGKFAGRWRVRAGIVCAATVGALAFGWSLYVALPVIQHQELQGSVTAFERVERKIPSSEVVYMEMPEGHDITASTFEYAYGRPVLPYDHDRFRKESGKLESAGLLDDAVYVTTDGGPAPLISGVDFTEVAEQKVSVPRLVPVEKELPRAVESLKLEYRIFRVEVER